MHSKHCIVPNRLKFVDRRTEMQAETNTDRQTRQTYNSLNRELDSGAWKSNTFNSTYEQFYHYKNKQCCNNTPMYLYDLKYHLSHDFAWSQYVVTLLYMCLTLRHVKQTWDA